MSAQSTPFRSWLLYGGAIAVFGVVVAGTMWWIRRWHVGNCVQHREEVERLLAIARADPH